VRGGHADAVRAVWRALGGALPAAAEDEAEGAPAEAGGGTTEAGGGSGAEAGAPPAPEAAPVDQTAVLAKAMAQADADGNTAMHYAAVATGPAAAAAAASLVPLIAPLALASLFAPNADGLAPSELALEMGNMLVAEALFLVAA